MIKEYILTKSLDFALKKLKKLRKELGLKLDADLSQIEESLNIHLQKVKNWAEEISFKDIKSPKQITDVFIHLDLEVMPKGKKFELDEKVENIPLYDLLDEKKHIVLLGQPGAGKTTSMKYFCHQLLFEDENNSFDNFSYPVLIKFRDVKKKKNQSYIFEELTNLFGLSLSIIKSVDKKQVDYSEALRKFVLSFLDTQNVLLILDGFDEIPHEESKVVARDEIKELANFLENSKVIVTSRSGDFNIHVPNAKEFEIAPLSDEQILDFSSKWLGNKKEGKEFYKKVKSSPFSDTAIRPLTLAHLCAIYERLGHIPKKPNSVYKKVIKLLLEEWDQQRSVKRTSEYAKFEVDRKFEFLSNLSYELTTHFEKTVFSSEELQRTYEFIYTNFDLEENESKKVVKELETHTGLILKSSHNSYQFAHKSLQEYLTADFIVKLPSIPTDKDLLLKLPNELAIAVTISSNSSSYFEELIIKRFSNIEITENFIATFINRLLLEKPDFNQRSTVILSLLNLYCLYIESSIKDENQLRLLVDNNLKREFELLIEKMLEKNHDAKRLIDKEYSHYEEINLYNGDKLDKYKRWRNSKDPKFIILPRELL